MSKDISNLKSRRFRNLEFNVQKGGRENGLIAEPLDSAFLELIIC